MEKVGIGVSSCLLGEKVRYDGGHKHDHYITDTLGSFFNFVPVCPEVEYGLPIPREPMHLAGNADDPRLVTIRTGIDLTRGMKQWAETKLDELAGKNIFGFIFKTKSPSSGMRGVRVYREGTQPLYTGVGIFAAAFMRRFPLIPVEDDGRLHDPSLRENFIERVFVLKRWQEMTGKNNSMGNLVDFHTRHKLLVMAHSPRHLSLLGKIVGDAKEFSPAIHSSYLAILMEGLRLIATTKKNRNVLDHIMGYFKKKLDEREKKEMRDIIVRYHQGYIPLIVPVTLLNHYVLKFEQTYLANQYYLNPHPIELMLRNHV
ncbi:MAG: YbgA family protein [Syntrophorhabdaceae bacterium]